MPAGSMGVASFLVIGSPLTADTTSGTIFVGLYIQTFNTSTPSQVPSSGVSSLDLGLVFLFDHLPVILF